jgi:hypothetical protein
MHLREDFGGEETLRNITEDLLLCRDEERYRGLCQRMSGVGSGEARWRSCLMREELRGYSSPLHLG